MKAVAFHQITVLTSAIGIGLPAGTPSAYNAASAYSVGNYVTYLTVEYYCIQAGTGKTPDSNPTYWLALDADGIPTNALYARLQCTGKGVCWTDDGRTTPTATVGNRLPPNSDTLSYSEVMYKDGDLGNIKVIETSATAVLNVTFYTN